MLNKSKSTDVRIDEVKTTIEDTLRYLGHSHFDVYVSAMKVVITLAPGSEHWFFYSLRRIERRDIIGEVVMWLMDRIEDTPNA